VNRSGILSRSGSALLFLSSYPSNLHWLPRLRLSLSVSCSFMLLDDFFKVRQLADFFSQANRIGSVGDGQRNRQGR